MLHAYVRRFNIMGTVEKKLEINGTRSTSKTYRYQGLLLKCKLITKCEMHQYMMANYRHVLSTIRLPQFFCSQGCHEGEQLFVDQVLICR